MSAAGLSHGDCVEQLKEPSLRVYGFKELKTKTFRPAFVYVGDFLIKPFSVPHMPGVPTFGFELHVQDKKLIIATDFLKWSGVFDHFVDADFIFVESNHDLKLLERYYNPNSQFHMPNPQTAELLVNVQRHSRRTIQTVMLGHISSQRNEAGIALKETRNAFSRANLPDEFLSFWRRL